MSKRKVSQSLLTDLFKKRTVTAGSSSSSCSESANSFVSANHSEYALSAPSPPPPPEDGQHGVVHTAAVQPTENLGKPSPHHPNDIGLYTNKTLGIFEKYEILKTCWQPPLNYTFPILEKFTTRKIKFQWTWFTEFPWLAYSEVQQGVYCKYCCLFAKQGVGINHQEVGAFVKRKFDNWKKAKEAFKNHERTQYHRSCLLDFKNLEKVKEKAVEPIVNQIDQARHDAVAKNRSHLKPIIDAVILCGRRELALRGHRDSGNIIIENERSESNEGNFRAILKYRSQGDQELMQVLNGSSKIKYLSPKVQNEIITSCNTIILRKLVDKINAAQGFSILADETSDISTVEQLSQCVRYVEVIDGQHFVKEDFLQFEQVTSMTGESLAKQIIECLQKYGIYVHCAAHALNLSVTKACEVQNIRNCLGVVEKVHTFFNTPKRQVVLLNCIEESGLNPRVKTVKRMSTTRWTSKYYSIQDFLHIMDFVIEALTIISSWKDGSDASTLKWGILNSDFIVSAHIVSMVFAYYLPLCKTLQKEAIDLKQMVNLSKTCLAELQSLRKNSEKEFGSIFKCVEAVANDQEVQLKTPRICGNQRNRSNSLSSPNDETSSRSTETYYRINVFIPFLDFSINQLNERFNKHESVFLGFQCLFEPVNDNDSCKEKLNDLVTFYCEDMQSPPGDIFIELKLWQNEVQRQGLLEDIFKSATKALDCCDVSLYPNIYRLLKILCTLPVTTVTPERTFSALKRVKTYLRNTTRQVAWIKADTKAILAIHEHVITNNARLTVTHNDFNTWTLNIKGVRREDRGMYMCQVNTDPMKSQTAFLEVVIPPDIIYEETSGDIMIPEGGSAKLQCNARGFPKPKILWKREDGHEIIVRGGNVAKSKMSSVEGESLILTKVTRSEMGAYLCIAANGVPPSVSKRMMLHVNFHPLIQVPNQLVGAPRDTDVALVCQVEASPKAINYWTRESGEMIIGNDKYMMVENSNSSYSTQMKLVIRKFSHADLGGYKCISKNSIGDSEGTIRLYEMELPRRKSDNYEENELGERIDDGRQGSLREDTGDTSENNEVTATDNENRLRSNCERPSSLFIIFVIPFVLCLRFVL